MALDLTADQKDLGRANAANVMNELSRRGFMKSLAAGAGGGAVVTAASYFGYTGFGDKPVRAALIGAGDEGGILVGEHNPDFLKFVAIADIRPSNQKRIIDGDPKVPLRKGFKKVYGQHEASKIKITDNYEELLKDPSIEAVVIALPLHLHAPVAIKAMEAGKHVLCEKLMAWNVGQCKKMIEVAKKTNRILSIGHQRHYSMLYAHASEVLKSGVLGDIRHIRAQWHRNNTWPFEWDATKDGALAKNVIQPVYRDGWFNPITQADYDVLNNPKKLKEYGYESVEELIRWRLYNATGGGLMAELGSHQLDACSIFLGKVHPLAVTGVGTKSFYGKGRNDRDSDDHVFVTFEFPGNNYFQKDDNGKVVLRDGKQLLKDKDDVVVVTYSSISTNQFEPYGECVTGSRGTMVVESETNLMLYNEKSPTGKGGAPRATTVAVTGAEKGKPALEASSTWGPAAAAPSSATAGAGPAGTTGAPVSRGYREEMEDFAYCIRNWGKDGYANNLRLPRCHGTVAMADAIIALTANLSMKKRTRIDFDEKWFDPIAKEVPDADQKGRFDDQVFKA
jgi:predicted dehydrogenase